MIPRKSYHPWLMLLPTLLVLTAFFVYPLLRAVYDSFFAWDMLTPPRYVGAANYRVLAESGDLTGILGRTLAYSSIVVVGSMSLGLFLAVSLNRRGRIFAFVRAAVFSAYVVSWVAVALLWMWLLDADGGLVSAGWMALGGEKIAWLGDPDTALYTLAAVSIWKITGYALVIFLAGLQDIPEELHEAAALDGAGPWRRFALITWPLLRPTAAFVGTTSLILSFQAFDVVRVMTQGGPVKSTTIFVYAIYEQVFMNLRVGRASALTVVFFAVLVVLTTFQLWAFRAASRGPLGAQP